MSDFANYRSCAMISMRPNQSMGKKAAWQQANPFHNISNDRGGDCG
jgi:hypothetical protein